MAPKSLKVVIELSALESLLSLAEIAIPYLDVLPYPEGDLDVANVLTEEQYNESSSIVEEKKDEWGS